MKKTPQQQDFGRWLKAHRLRLDITASVAAQGAGMDPTTWRALEAPNTPWHQPTPKTVKIIAGVLGVPVEDVAQKAGVWMPTEAVVVVQPTTPDVGAKLDELTDELRRLVDVLGRLPGLEPPPRARRRGPKAAP